MDQFSIIGRNKGKCCA